MCTYVKKGYDYFDITAITAALVVICLVNYLMSMASHFSYYNKDIPKSSSSKTSNHRLRSQRSDHRQRSNIDNDPYGNSPTVSLVNYFQELFGTALTFYLKISIRVRKND